MLVATGYFDAKGNPCLKVSLAGVFINPPGIEFQAIIDTGFSGFLCMPIVSAFPLGLPLHGTTSAVLADGNKNTCLTALCRVTVGKRMQEGVVLLQNQSKDFLIGMDFLRKFQASLFMTKSSILLLDENALDQMAKQTLAAAQKAKAVAVPPEAKPEEQAGKPQDDKGTQPQQ